MFFKKVTSTDEAKRAALRSSVDHLHPLWVVSEDRGSVISRGDPQNIFFFLAEPNFLSFTETGASCVGASATFSHRSVSSSAVKAAEASWMRRSLSLKTLGVCLLPHMFLPPQYFSPEVKHLVPPPQLRTFIPVFPFWSHPCMQSRIILVLWARGPFQRPD